jgi:hypothetical protein
MPAREHIGAAAESAPPDYGLITPISIPEDGKIPDAAVGTSSRDEYDRYFRLVREQPELVTWSRSCLDVQRRLLDDLWSTGLSAEERCDILAGCLVVLLSTLEKWLVPDAVAEVAA